MISSSRRAPLTLAPLTLALIGLGPRGAGLLERLVSNSLHGPFAGSPVEVHLIDPYADGGGRVWRDAQSDLLRLNTTAEDLTAFVDDSVTMEGPVTSGPTMFEWCRIHGVDLAEPGLAAEAAAIEPIEFPSRRLANAYFRYALDRSRRRAPEWMSIVTHPQRAVDLFPGGSPGEPAVVVLEDGERVVADGVAVLTSHGDVRPGPVHAELAAFATEHRLTYLPPGYGGDLDLSAVRPGQETIVRGMGLGFVDLMILLTEGRGGRFTTDGAGQLVYRPSGCEPRLLVGSRRGVPYHAKPMYRLRAGQPALRFCTPEAISELLQQDRPITFRADLWPLIEQEVAWASYVELAAHPGRLGVPWAEFAATFAELPWGSAEHHHWLATAVPDPADRLDLLGLDRPLRDVEAANRGRLSELIRGYVRADLARRADARFSADLGAFHALLRILPVIGPALGSPRMDPASLTADFFGWFMGFFSFYASGPPQDRLEQLLALEEAGIVSFLGADLEVTVDPERSAFVARTSTVPGEVATSALIEATLPAFDLRRTADPLLSRLAHRGAVTSQVLTDSAGRQTDTGQVRVDAGHRLVGADGTAADRVFALGMHTVNKTAAFARPHTDAPVHRHNDQVARALLGLSRSPVPETGPPPPPIHTEPIHQEPIHHAPTHHHRDQIAALSGGGGR